MMEDQAESILVLEAGGIGDAVLATPALSALRERFPDARITVVMAPRAVEIVEMLGLDFRIKTLRLGRPVWQLVDAACLITFSRGADLLIDLSSIESDRAALARLAQAGLKRARDFDVDRMVAAFAELYEEMASECID